MLSDINVVLCYVLSQYRTITIVYYVRTKDKGQTYRWFSVPLNPGRAGGWMTLKILLFCLLLLSAKKVSTVNGHYNTSPRKMMYWVKGWIEKLAPTHLFSWSYITQSQDANLNCQKKFVAHCNCADLQGNSIFCKYSDCIMYLCWQDVVSLNKVSLNIVTGFFQSLDFKTLGQKNHPWFWCVPTLGRLMSCWDWLGRM